MSDEYAIDVDEFFRSYRKNEAELKDKVCEAMEVMSLHSWSDEYELYGVDNDFDLAEAMYEVYSQSTCNLVRNPDFVKFRVKCAMRPEYTERCLKSRAFYDVRGRILRRLCLRPWRWPQLVRFVGRTKDV